MLKCFVLRSGGGRKDRSGKLQEEKKRQQIQTKLQVLLFRHKELLKKDILKKRALLEKDLQIQIQVQPTHMFSCYWC